MLSSNIGGLPLLWLSLMLSTVCQYLTVLIWQSTHREMGRLPSPSLPSCCIKARLKMRTVPDKLPPFKRNEAAVRINSQSFF
jgi:hypothetical protein